MITTFTPKGQIYGSIMPTWLMKRKDVSHGAKLLYAAMVSCSAAGSDHCWPSQAWLAEYIGASIRSVQSYIKELVSMSLISIERSRLGSSLRYVFLKADIVEVMPAKHAELTSATIARGYATIARGYAKVADVYNKNNKYKYNPPLPPTREKEETTTLPLCASGGGGSSFQNLEESSAEKSAENAFSELWKIWPRKEACSSAFKEWRKLWFSGELPPVNQLIQRVKILQNKDRSWLRGYAPYLINWLRDKRWKDEISTLTEQKQEEKTANRHENTYSQEERHIRINGKLCDPSLATFASMSAKELAHYFKSSQDAWLKNKPLNMREQRIAQYG